MVLGTIPYAVEDYGNGTAKILIYDNNIPEVPQAVEINRIANTWKYNLSVSPDEPPENYAGDANTKSLEIVSISSRLQKQDCDFCANYNTSANATNISIGRAQIWIIGDGSFLVTNKYGQRMGYLNNSTEFVNEIPNAHTQNLNFESDLDLELGSSKRYLLDLPANQMTYSIRLDGLFKKNSHDRC